MAKFLLGVIAGVAAAVLGIVLAIWLALWLESKPPNIADNSVLALRLAGRYPGEGALALPAIFGQGGGGLTVANVWMALRKAAADPRIKAVVVEPEDLIHQGGRGSKKCARISSRFRNSGKPVFAYLREPGRARILPGAGCRPHLSWGRRNRLC